MFTLARPIANVFNKVALGLHDIGEQVDHIRISNL